MARKPRIQFPGAIYHIVTRGDSRRALFHDDGHYDRFTEGLKIEVLRSAWQVISYCVMPNHWHFVVQPKTNTQVIEFFRWLTHTHTMRWHAHYHTEGTGHLYKGRFKTFPIEEDQHLLAVLRYVERNALRANLVEKAEDWKYGSLWRAMSVVDDSIVSQWPIPRPRTWRAMVNRPLNGRDLKAVRKCVKKGCLYGSDRFVTQASSRLKLKHSLKERGRPSWKVDEMSCVLGVPFVPLPQLIPSREFRVLRLAQSTQ